jgi:hypothetical protein
LPKNKLIPSAPEPDEVASWRRIGDEVEARLLALGFRSCSWLESQRDLTLASFREHARTCASCAARDRIAREYEVDEPEVGVDLTAMTLGTVSLVFAGTLVLGIGIVSVLEVLWDIPPLQAIPIVGGAILIAGAVGKPRWFAETIRHLPPLTHIQNDALARVLLVGFGLICGLIGVMGWLK